MAECLIELSHMNCSYFMRKSRIALGLVEVLHNLNLQIFAGETLGVLGNNGAGKSTLLQVLARILLPTGGTATFRDGLKTSLLSLQLGFSPELSGRENALLGAMYLGFSRREAEARLPRILDFAELGDWVNKPVHTYSTGMSARLGFAVAIEMEPDVMLVDEVLGVGDAYYQKKSANALRAKMQSGQTTVLVTHNAFVLRQLCTRAVWLRDGSICMEGDPAQVSGAYRNWVAGLESETAGSA